MVFSSITFIFYFLPIVLAIYYIVPHKFKNIVLLVASLLFYFYGEPKYVITMVISIIITYIFGILINKYRKYDKIFLILSIFINVGILVYFKYTNFIIQNINLWLSKKIDFIYVALPIGISFYTFQLISYIVDVYRKDVDVQKNFFNLAMYISLFPQLIAGPIVRYSTIEKQITQRTHTFLKFSIGVRRFIVGLGKKVLIANVLGELCSVFLNSNDNSVLFYWLYAIANMLQIYFDFSGYSDMAIGLGKMFGFEFTENFNYPYISSNVREFWKRWHISLSSWYRDYIYIPLGGNRVSTIKWVRNILIVWFLTGLWHGAAWNFIVWGIYFGIILIIEKIFLNKISNKVPIFLSRICTLLIIMISFIIFSGEGIEEIVRNIEGLVAVKTNYFATKESIYYFKSYFIIIIVGILGSTPIFRNITKTEKFHKLFNFLEPFWLAVVMLLSTCYIIDRFF